MADRKKPAAPKPAGTRYTVLRRCATLGEVAELIELHDPPESPLTLRVFVELDTVPASGPEQAARAIAAKRLADGCTPEEAAGEFRAVASSSWHTVKLVGKTETTFSTEKPGGGS